MSVVKTKPVKVEFKSQNEIVAENQKKRKIVLLALDQMREAQKQVSASKQ